MALALAAFAFSLTAIVAAFWYQDWRYSLPTPKPATWQPVPLGARVELPQAVMDWAPGVEQQPLFLHFFNPDCPCSRFNLDHLRELVHAYRHKARFVAILQGEDSATTQKRFADLDTGIPGVPDVDRRIANACGVYSTPQAVLLDSDQRLLFRGNYNVSRYCTERSTAFARIALESALAGQVVPGFPTAATTAYGCELPQAWRPGKNGG